MRIERQLMRGTGPLVVLKLLERGEMYGYEMVEALVRRPESILAAGQSSLYPLLYNLEAKGLIEGTWRDGPAARAPADTGAGTVVPVESVAAVRERKYYKITGRGKRRLSKDTERWQAVAKVIAAMKLVNVVGQGVALGVPA